MKQEYIDRLYRLVFFMIDDDNHDTLNTGAWEIYCEPFRIDYIQLRSKTILLWYRSGYNMYDIDIKNISIKHIKLLIENLENIMINVPKD